MRNKVSLIFMLTLLCMLFIAFPASAADVSASITLTAPNGGETWLVGNDNYIFWNYTGTIGQNLGSTVKIDLLKNGVYHSTIAASTSTSTRYYRWNIPSTVNPGTDYKIRITDTTNGNTFDLSNSNFTINWPPATITITAPNGGETWLVGSDNYIYWNYSGTIGKNLGSTVKIELLKNGVYHSTISASTSISTRYYRWNIPTTVNPGTDYQIRLTDTTNGNTFDLSNNNFAINWPPATITITAPNGGENWLVGSDNYIYWNYSGTIGKNLGSTVKIELLKNGVYHSTISASTSISTRYYRWNIPSTVNPGTDYQIRLTDTTNGNTFDLSNNSFTINWPPAAITITAPNGGENWLVGSANYIYWNYSGTIGKNLGSTVKIELLKNGAYHSTIAASTATSTRYYRWNIPSAVSPGADYKVRITDTTNGNTFDLSNNNFAIYSNTPQLNILTPNAGQSWVAGTANNITWTYSGIPGTNLGTNVKIDLLKDGQYISTITSSTSIGTTGTGSYSWQIPDTLRGIGYQIKVTDTSNSSISHTSQAFNILKNGASASFVSNTLPAVMEIGKTYTAEFVVLNDGNTTWTTSYPIHYLIETYRESSQITTQWYTPVSTNISPGQTATFSVKLEAVQYPQTYNSQWKMYNNNYFGDALYKTIDIVMPGTIQVVAPIEGQPLGLGTTQNITWTFSGNVGSNVKIELLKNGAVQSVIAPQTSIGASGSGSYSWAIPSNTPKGTGYQIKVTDTGNSSVYSLSGTFGIWANGDSADIISDTIPTTMQYGQTYTATVTLLNDGNSTWTASGYNFCSHETGYDPLTDQWYLVLPRNIAPGESITLDMTFRIKDNSFLEGSTNLSWQMYSGYSWFGETLSKIVQVLPAS